MRSKRCGSSQRYGGLERVSIQPPLRMCKIRDKRPQVSDGLVSAIPIADTGQNPFDLQ